MIFRDVWEESVPWKTPKGLWLCGTLSLWAYSLFSILLPNVGSLAGTLSALLGLLAVLTYGKGVRGSAVLWLLLVALIVQTISWAFGYFHHPEWVADNPQLDRLAKLFIFITVAWWLGGSTRHTMLIWGLALVGYLIASFTHGNGVQEWLLGLHGKRTGFGIRNMQHGSMLFGVMIVGLIVFAKRWILNEGKISTWRTLIWCLFLIVCVVGVAIGQTRAVWLALFISLPFAAVLWGIWVSYQRGVKYSLKLFSLCVAVFLSVAIVGATFFKEPLLKRVTVESGVVEKLISGQFDQIPYTSIGIRINSWIAATEWIAERPILGWGGQGRSLVIDHTEWLPDFVKQNFGHLHNFFIEVWVAYGLLGVLVIATLAVWIGRGTWLAWRGGVMPNDVALFGAAFFVYWMIVNQFESYNSFGTGVYVHNLVVGGLVTHIWRWQWESGQRVFPTSKR